MEAILALEDGTWFRGAAAGAEGEARGEVVFNTSMTGYQEVLTDPSYAGQIVTMTCPEIGNYGVVDGGRRVARRRRSPASSSATSRRWPATGARRGTLRDYLVANNIVAIADIDTRALTRQLRSGGVMRGVIATGSQLDPQALVEQARAIPPMEGSDLVRGVTPRRGVRLAATRIPDEFGVAPERLPKRRLKIAAYDFGMKWNILRRLERARLRRARLSGDDAGGGAAGDEAGRHLPQQRPRRSGGARPTRSTTPRRWSRPTCRSSASASATRCSAWRWAATTFKLKFGHRGANHPVKKLDDRQGRDHVAEPRLRGRPGVAAGRRRGDAPQPVRRHGRRAAAHDAAGLLRAVPSRGVAGPARRRLPVRRFHRS